jgi:predicted transcriptional regulator
MAFSLIDLLQSSGPIALNELSMRSSESPEELVRTLEELRKEGMIVVSGPSTPSLPTLTREEIEHSSDIVVELSRSTLKRSFAI